MDTICWGNLITNLILSKGLKHLWGLVNLMQFMVFFPLWELNYTYDMQNFLLSARSLALMEFLPTEQFTDWLSDWFGLNTCAQSCDDLIEEAIDADTHETPVYKDRRLL